MVLPNPLLIVPLILLLLRSSHFHKFTLDDLPLLLDSELSAMKKASLTSILVFFAFIAMSIALPLILFPNNRQAGLRTSFLVIFLGMITAVVFDLKAERIKSRGRSDRTQKEDQIRWYHLVVPLVFPYIGGPWGIVNLCRKKKKTGVVMIMVACVWLFIWLLLVYSAHPAFMRG